MSGLFQTAGLMCAVPGNVPIDFPTIKGFGYSYMSPQGCNGARQVGDNTAAGERDPAKYKDGLHEAKLLCVPWAKLYGGTKEEVTAEAKASAQAIARIRPDGWMLNPETEFKDDGRWRSKVYVDALKAELARLAVPLDSVQWVMQPLGGASVPAGRDVSPWAFDFDTQPWLTLPGVVCMPEAYWAPKDDVDGAASSYRPFNCADAWITKLGWPAERFAFTLGWWNTSFAAPDLYMADLETVRWHYPTWPGGIALYLADQAPADVIRSFVGQAIAKGLAKVEPPAVTVPAPKPPPAPPVVNPAEVRAAIVTDADTYLTTRPGPEATSRLRIIRRIAQSDNVDAKWSQVRDQVKALLDKAGIA